MKISNHARSLLFNITILLAIGVMVLAGVSGPSSQIRYGSPFIILLKQVCLAIIPGVILGFLFFNLKDLKIIKKYAFHLSAVSYFLMLLVFVPFIGIRINGAQRWLNLGITTFQPSEMFKLACIAFFAYFLTERKLTTLKESFIFLLGVGIAMFPVLLQKDLSTFLVLMFAILTMYLCSNTKFTHIITIALVCALFVGLLIIIEPYRVARLMQFQNPDLDPLGSGYHISQSLITVGSGGIYGLGLGLSKQKFGSLPQPTTDSIYSVMSEEMGFVGAITVILLYLWFIVQGLNIGNQSKGFEKLLAIGITCWIGAQAFINISSTVGLLPITGLPLPFISSGGTAMLFILAGCGILLNISNRLP